MQLTDHTTIPQLIRNVVKYIHPVEHTFLIHKVNDTYENISYKTALTKIDAISTYLISIGVQKTDRLALMMDNCPDYIFFDQALQQLGATNVSIYPTVSEQDVAYIINDSSSKVILIGNPFLLKKVLKVANECPSLSHIVPTFDDYQKITKDGQYRQTIISLNEVIAEGKNKLNTYAATIDEMREAVTPNDIAALIYTSGTTGKPKGVMLTHLNFVHNVKVSLVHIPHINNEETFLSFLPLSHVFERTGTYHMCLAKGCKIAFAQSLELLGKNMMEVKPTIMACVPRLLEKIHDKAMKTGLSSGGLKTKIFVWAIGIGSKYRFATEDGEKADIILQIQHQIADKLVFSKIKAKTGGNLKFMISGGAALPQNVGEFFGNLGIKVLEGYGLTETAPVMAVTEFHRQVYGTVGRVVPELVIGIQNADTKEIYTEQTWQTFDPNFESVEGEIILKGPNVMKGYWNKPEETAAVIDTDGWFHTGDVGKFYKGNLKITDRIKNMIVNSFGKNVYPTPIENIYLKSPKIDQLFLIGDKQEYITAIIVPSKESLQEEFNLADSYFEEKDLFITNAEMHAWINEDVKKLSNELAKYERIKNFILKRNPFTIENGEITPTLKTKRKVIETKFSSEIAAMYQDEEMPD